MIDIKTPTEITKCGGSTLALVDYFSFDPRDLIEIAEKEQGGDRYLIGAVALSLAYNLPFITVHDVDILDYSAEESYVKYVGRYVVEVLSWKEVPKIDSWLLERKKEFTFYPREYARVIEKNGKIIQTVSIESLTAYWLARTVGPIFEREGEYRIPTFMLELFTILAKTKPDPNKTRESLEHFGAVKTVSLGYKILPKTPSFSYGIGRIAEAYRICTDVAEKTFWDLLDPYLP